jgi:N-methylhydantoinase A
MTGNLRVSIDTGGTFTDVLAVDGATGTVHVIKTPSVREDPSQALLAGIDRVLEVAAKDYSDIEMVIHGTTTATNAVLEHEFSGIGLLVTEGFRHILEIARQSVPDGYGNSFFWVKPPRLVPLHLVREVPERMLFDGTVFRSLDADAVVRAAGELVALGVNRLGVCLLHSYANPDHERQVAALLAEHYPELFISLSSVVLPEYREYERAMTTLVDVMVKPYCRDYLGRARHRLDERVADLPFLIMQSNGGVVTAKAAADKPVTMLLSGPAGGVLGAIEAAKAAGMPDLITLDVGGTSTDVALIDGLEIRLTSETVIEDYPVKVPMIDIATVGTGGGSLAWVGPNNALKVGPKSAGAVPGPICYGRGGTQPTVTDAAAILGMFPASLVGGDLRLDVDSARTAMAEFGGNFGLTVEDAAAGILEVATAGQVTGIRQVSTLKGRDPSGYCLVAFGGAGPLLATAVAEFLNIQSVLVPPNPGNLSALGLQVTDVKRDYVRTHVRMADADSSDVERIWTELEAIGTAELVAEGAAPDRIDMTRGADLRYEGEGYEVTVMLSSDGARDLGAAVAAFHTEHERVYGFSYPGQQNVELVNIRVQAVGHTQQTGALQELPADREPAEARSNRPVYWRQHGWVDCAIYDRAALAAGQTLAGPTVVEEYGATVVIPRGWSAVVDRYGNLVVTRSDVA